MEGEGDSTAVGLIKLL